MFISHHPLFLTIYSSQNIHWLVLRGAVNTSKTRPARPKRATQSVTLAEPTTDRRNPPPPQGPIVFSPTGACCSTVQTASCPIQRAHDTNFPCSYFCAQHFKVCQLAQWWISSPWDIGPDFCRKKISLISVCFSGIQCSSPLIHYSVDADGNCILFQLYIIRTYIVYLNTY